MWNHHFKCLCERLWKCIKPKRTFSYQNERCYFYKQYLFPHHILKAKSKRMTIKDHVNDDKFDGINSTTRERKERMRENKQKCIKAIRWGGYKKQQHHEISSRYDWKSEWFRIQKVIKQLSETYGQVTKESDYQQQLSFQTLINTFLLIHNNTKWKAKHVI